MLLEALEMPIYLLGKQAARAGQIITVQYHKPSSSSYGVECLRQ